MEEEIRKNREKSGKRREERIANKGDGDKNSEKRELESGGSEQFCLPPVSVQGQRLRVTCCLLPWWLCPFHN